MRKLGRKNWSEMRESQNLWRKHSTIYGLECCTSSDFSLTWTFPLTEYASAECTIDSKCSLGFDFFFAVTCVLLNLSYLLSVALATFKSQDTSE